MFIAPLLAGGREARTAVEGWASSGSRRRRARCDARSSGSTTTC